MPEAETYMMGYREAPTIDINIIKETDADGVVLLRSAIELEPHPYRLTERLKHWASVAPDRVFIGRRNKTGNWETHNYADTYKKVIAIAHSLLQRKISVEQPIAILSENSIEHALLALAALHVGLPYAAIASAYSLRSTDFAKLRHVINLLTPGLLFVQDAEVYKNALQAVADNVEVVAVNTGNSFKTTSFENLSHASIDEAAAAEVEAAYQAIKPETIAKVLFTSGSTGLPKGVINTHGNISANWQQITQTFPFLQDEGLEFIDWLPWNHTFGGNHNFGLTVYNGGSLYIDDGNPTPQGILTTLANLKERKPTVYFNVPKGFEGLLPYFKNDKELCGQFFCKLKMLFYAGAGMPQHVWDAWEELATETIGKKVLIGTGLGCTEACPSALFSSKPGGFAGLLGVPVPGLQLKLFPVGGKLEARYKGKNIFPGYWRQPELTAKAFDAEGFYCTGDALKFADVNDVNKGMLFDGRIAEDFKLITGTWVSVGVLRAQLIAAGNGLIQEAIITGHDNKFIGAIVFAGTDYCKKIAGLRTDASLHEIINHAIIKQRLQDVLNTLADKNTGSASLIRKAVFADFTLSIDKGEITDKGSVNQRAIIENHPELINKIYSSVTDDAIIEIKNKTHV